MFFKPKHPLVNILTALEEWKLPCMVITSHSALEDVIVDFVGDKVVEFIQDDVDTDEGVIFTVRTVLLLEDIKSVTYDYTSTNLEHEHEGTLYN